MSTITAENFIIGKELKDFIISIANSSIKSEILEFIYYNPGRIINPLTVAQSIGRKEEQVRKAMSEFTGTNIFKEVKIISDTSYIPVEKNKFHYLLDKFIKLFSSRNGREKVRSIIDSNIQPEIIKKTNSNLYN